MIWGLSLERYPVVPASFPPRSEKDGKAGPFNALSLNPEFGLNSVGDKNL